MAKKLIETFKTPMTPAEWITSSLDMHNMTNIALAKKLYVASTLICSWKKGSQKIPLNYCRQLSEIFGADPIYVRNLLVDAYAPGNWREDEELRFMGSLTKKSPRAYVWVKKYSLCTGTPDFRANERDIRPNKSTC